MSPEEDLGGLNLAVEKLVWDQTGVHDGAKKSLRDTVLHNV